MAKYILVYRIDDYPGNGGGLNLETFDADISEQDLQDRVNELAGMFGNQFVIEMAGFLSKEFVYKPVEIVTRYERDI